ncbi:SAM-dependent methyltransferase [Glutamicibacter sp.]|uniref:SAM-dependent methyltransferase n=1 Tax=Glutamicibacter sp. TaxID=1931995 RepID=UPI0028BE0B53|nr:SAM-dependent methyltransferase [Glutamicibacter sp.]
MSKLLTDPPQKHTAKAQEMRVALEKFVPRFESSIRDYDGSTLTVQALDELLGEYSTFTTHAPVFEAFSDFSAQPGSEELIIRLRELSARGVAIMEKYRALHLLAGRSSSAEYFLNIESCIAEEFGAVAPTATSRILLIGCGAFPMTLLRTAQHTGASACGIDIDGEALELGRQVVDLLGDGLEIRLSGQRIDELEEIGQVTHVVISSTVSVKYELLQQLHALTRQDVVVAMRFGDHLKSLFNYPSQPVDSALWHLERIVSQPNQVFDIALYVKPEPKIQEPRS